MVTMREATVFELIPNVILLAASNEGSHAASQASKESTVTTFHARGIRCSWCNIIFVQIFHNVYTFACSATGDPMTIVYIISQVCGMQGKTSAAYARIYLSLATQQFSSQHSRTLLAHILPHMTIHRLPFSFLPIVGLPAGNICARPRSASGSPFFFLLFVFECFSPIGLDAFLAQASMS